MSEEQHGADVAHAGPQNSKGAADCRALTFAWGNELAAAAPATIIATVITAAAVVAAVMTAAATIVVAPGAEDLARAAVDIEFDTRTGAVERLDLVAAVITLNFQDAETLRRQAAFDLAQRQFRLACY